MLMILAAGRLLNRSEPSPLLLLLLLPLVDVTLMLWLIVVVAVGWRAIIVNFVVLVAITTKPHTYIAIKNTTGTTCTQQNCNGRFGSRYSS